MGAALAEAFGEDRLQPTRQRCEVRVYQDLGGAELRGAIELVSPANKDREASRRTFAARCASHLKHGIGVVVVDVVTNRQADLHRELFDLLEVKTAPNQVEFEDRALRVLLSTCDGAQRTPSGGMARGTLARRESSRRPSLAGPRSVRARALEESYQAACRSLRIPLAG